MLPWPLYLQINDWFMEEGTAEGVFGAIFSKLTVNLTCREDNKKQVCLSISCTVGTHLPFHSPMKNAIREGMTHKAACTHCYGNPLDVSANFVSSVFH